MLLQTISYSQFLGSENEWILHQFDLGNINLIVGKNASGKSRLINIINGLAGLVSQDSILRFSSGDYTLTYRDADKIVKYHLKYEESKVIEEKYEHDGKTLLTRMDGGKGKIFAEELNHEISFQVPVNKIAVISKQDEVQHSFLQRLITWGENVKIFRFGTHLGQEQLAVVLDPEQYDELDIKDPNKVVAILRSAIHRYGDDFKQILLNDLETIGYPCDEIGIGEAPNISFQGGLKRDPIGIYVREKDLLGRTFQIEMSQGMFRAISLLIQINIILQNAPHGCVLIDDIGEGLDFERSTSIINLLVSKFEKSKSQLIMSTNDRFVMNGVPLKYWNIIERKRNECFFYNYSNSKELFDQFKYTGLNNFDFFTSEYFKIDEEER